MTRLIEDWDHTRGQGTSFLTKGLWIDRSKHVVAALVNIRSWERGHQCVRVCVHQLPLPQSLRSAGGEDINRKWKRTRSEFE